jgi:hypothetical protein
VNLWQDIHQMIPSFNHSHVLPPFLGDSPTAAANTSPYECSSLEMVRQFAISHERCALLKGWLRYRADLRQLGFVQGFQWVDGSFSEDVEVHEQRAPGDVDVVTFALPPLGKTKQEINVMLAANPSLFNRSELRSQYGCDAFLVPMDTSPDKLVKRSTYYFQLFSHRRSDHVWKGLLQIPLESDDDKAMALLDNMKLGDSYVAPA